MHSSMDASGFEHGNGMQSSMDVIRMRAGNRRDAVEPEHAGCGQVVDGMHTSMDVIRM